MSVLTLPDCCIDVRFAFWLRDLAYKVSPGEAATERRVRFLQSPFVRQVLRSWSEAIEVSLYDIECLNAVLVRSFGTGMF